MKKQKRYLARSPRRLPASGRSQRKSDRIDRTNRNHVLSFQTKGRTVPLGTQGKILVKGRILADGELIYSRDENKRIEFETQVRKAYFDFLPVIQQYQNAYRERVLPVQDYEKER